MVKELVSQTARQHVWDTIDEDDFVEEESTTIQVKRAQNFAFPDFPLFSDDCFDDFFRTLLFPSEMISVVLKPRGRHSQPR